ncbi:heparinase II/III family protein [Microbulbifer sp. JMSA002]|uniref:heparinase II/III family protein n=1 Tax=Microbulbifer sp. JMSA002 TaxID=3243368 RepID=UPI004039D990
MSINNLKMGIASETKLYIDKNIFSRNQTDYNKLKKLFSERKYEANSFSDVDLDVLNFDWNSVKCDRNWWWQLQALPFLNWYINSYKVQTKEERLEYFSLCLKAILCWINNGKDNKDSPLVWHDHASAFRLKNLVNWFIFCQVAELPVGADVKVNWLEDLVFEHLDWLQDDKNYSIHTNHGFDQAMIGLTVSLMFTHDNFESYRRINRERLENEVTFAFTVEGVHKENSPGYQKAMLGRLRQLTSLSVFGEDKVTKLGEHYIAKAESFLKAITLPNGYLPIIGDTRSEDKGLVDDEIPEEGYRVYDYSSSGYLIVKGKIKKKHSFTLIFKCCHDSNYHRHDDDLMIYLHVDGETLLGDGGLGLHDEKNPKRKYLRSVHAHTMPVINRPFIRERSKLSLPPKLIHETNKKVLSGISYGYGIKVMREIDYSNLNNGLLIVRDECDDQDLSSNWIIGDRDITLSNKGVKIEFTNFRLVISSDQSESKRIMRGWSSNELSTNSIFSKKYGQFSKCNRVLLGGLDKSLEVRLKIE